MVVQRLTKGPWQLSTIVRWRAKEFLCGLHLQQMKWETITVKTVVAMTGNANVIVKVAQAIPLVVHKHTTMAMIYIHFWRKVIIKIKLKIKIIFKITINNVKLNIVQ